MRADEPDAPKSDSAASVTFGDAPFFHRWSREGQNEYTPRGQEDLERWTEMLTINVHEGVTDGDQLAELANIVLERYRGVGEILRTSSVPRTADHPAEHFAVAVLGTEDLVEAVFARFLLRDGVGYVIVYSRRIYGETARDDAAPWLRVNGRTIEKRLMGWEEVPTLAELRALPQN